ncbi:MAG TPA: M23 family metallopeptidase [Terracidiphilus sp.]|jgi:murein DD-endopeptidase MepM/ murein hydrolase activator NlpD
MLASPNIAWADCKHGTHGFNRDAAARRSAPGESYNESVRKVLLFLILIAVVAIVVVMVRSATPVLDLTTPVTSLGQATPISVHVRDAHGIKRASAVVEQNGAQYQVWQLSQATKAPDSTWNFTAGIRSTPQLKDGKAKLIVEAVSNDLRGKSARIESDLSVVTQPPTVSVDSEQHYLYLGMADLATFNVSGGYSQAGVRVGDQSFRAWPMPGGKSGLFSLFAFAWNMPAGTIPLVFASNGAGNDVTSPITVQFPKKEQPKYTTHELQVSDAFMQKVVGELDPNGSGDPVPRFVKINSEMRRANNKTLADLRFKTADHFLFSQPFTRQSHSQSEATFADLRNYIYHGQKIDQQVHLGYDLAVTQHVGVEASNDGKIVYAAPLGIYGNCVVVDHGYGLQTIYGHMSHIDVHEGDMVKRGQVMGQSGMTGMAGGDHIHFAMQLDGVQIDPKEWWDPHWIQDHIARRVDLPGFNATAAGSPAPSARAEHKAGKHHGRR